MKIAIVFPRHSEALFNKDSQRTFGGASIQVYNIAKELSNYKDIKTYSLIPNYKKIDFLDENSFNLAKTFNENDNLIVKIIKFHWKLKKIKADIVIQRGLTPFSCLLALYCRIRNIKFVFMFAHDIEAEGRYQSSQKKCFLFRLLLNNAYKLVSQNKYEYNLLLKSNISKKKIFTLKKGLAFSKLFQNKEKVFDAIWIGRCERFKHPELFLDLVERNPKNGFLMICPKVDSKKNYFKKVKKRAQKIKNLEFIEFIENKEIYKRLSQSKVFIFTSEKEGDWPMVVLEAAASRVSILSYSLNYDDLIDKYNGGIFCNGDFNLLNRRFNGMLTSQNKLEEMGENAYKYVKENHDIKVNAKKLLEIIKND